MTREDIERMTTAPDCFVPTPEVVRELARRALAQDRARRVGGAVIAAGETGVWMIEWAIESMLNGVGFDADDTSKLLAIRAALRGEP